MKGLLCYFSGTGNTKWIADHLSHELQAQDHEIQLVNIERPGSTETSNYDFLIIGTPVHSELAPQLVEEFVAQLPTNQRVEKCLVFSTQGVISAAAVNVLSAMLTAKGYPVTVQAMFRMPNSYYFGAGIQPTPEKIQRYHRDALPQVQHVAEAFAKGEQQLAHASGLRLGMSTLLARAYRRMLPRLAKKLSTADQCTGCGLCVRGCPKGNIRMDGQRPVFGGDCVMCTRCIHGCPVNAIRYGGKKVEQTQKEMLQVLE